MQQLKVSTAKYNQLRNEVTVKERQLDLYSNERTDGIAAYFPDGNTRNTVDDNNQPSRSGDSGLGCTDNTARSGTSLWDSFASLFRAT